MALNSAWKELFGGTAPPGQPATMTLAGVPAPDSGGGGGNANLKANVGPWHEAGNTAGELRTSTATSLTDLDTANDGVGGGTTGSGRRCPPRAGRSSRTARTTAGPRA
ncbi:hypothetical protein [Streptomyces zaomyceticus]|uniref:hypothetical protein n=1 Tax=Streptomyces zaomyceticus TaxID=68286 RepID=UPI00342071A7